MLTNEDPVSSVPSLSGEPPSLLDYVEIILKHWKKIFYPTLITGILTTIYTLFIPNVYTAKTLLLPTKDESGISGMLSQLGGIASLVGGGIPGGSSSTDLYASMLRSEAIQDKIIDKFELTERSGETIRSRIYAKLSDVVQISIGLKDNIITITVDDKDPRFAAAVANAYVEELKNLMIRLNSESSGSNRLFLENRLKIAKTDLLKSEDALKSFQNSNKSISIPDQVKATFEGIGQLRAQLANAEVQLSMLRRQFTDTSQEVKSNTNLINNLKNQIKLLEGKGDNSAILTIGAAPELGQQYFRLIRDLKTQETLLELLTKQYEMAKLYEQNTVSPFQVLLTAKTPEIKSSPKRAKIVILTTLACIFFTTLFAMLYEKLTRLPDNVRQRIINLRQYINLPYRTIDKPE